MHSNVILKALNQRSRAACGMSPRALIYGRRAYVTPAIGAWGGPRNWWACPRLLGFRRGRQEQGVKCASSDADCGAGGAGSGCSGSGAGSRILQTCCQPKSFCSSSVSSAACAISAKVNLPVALSSSRSSTSSSLPDTMFWDRSSKTRHHQGCVIPNDTRPKP
jgi:hypothetical protein